MSGGEIGLQWLPLRVPGNVRVIVTATHPDPNYLQLHELKIRQHMANPHQSLLSSQPSDNPIRVKGTHGSGGRSGGGSIGKGKSSSGTGEEGEAEYESSHRRRKVSRQTHHRWSIGLLSSCSNGTESARNSPCFARRSSAERRRVSSSSSPLRAAGFIKEGTAPPRHWPSMKAGVFWRLTMCYLPTDIRRCDISSPV